MSEDPRCSSSSICRTENDDRFVSWSTPFTILLMICVSVQRHGGMIGRNVGGRVDADLEYVREVISMEGGYTQGDLSQESSISVQEYTDLWYKV